MTQKEHIAKLMEKKRLQDGGANILDLLKEEFSKCNETAFADQPMVEGIEDAVKALVSFIEQYGKECFEAATEPTKEMLIVSNWKLANRGFFKYPDYESYKDSSAQSTEGK